MSSAPTKTDKAKRAPLTPRRIRRRIWRAGLFTFLALLGAWIVITRTPIAKRIILPRVVSALTVDLDVGSIVIAPDLRLILRDVSMRVPGIPGEAGEFVRVGRIEIEPDWIALGAGRAGASRIELIDPLVRLSQDVATGRLNLLDIELPTESSGSLDRLPTLLVRGAQVSYGEHDDAGYTELASVRGTGTLTPSSAEEPGRYIVRFDATSRGSGNDAREAPFSVIGRIDDSGAEIAFSDLVIGRVDPTLFPVTIRDAVEALDIEGRAIAERLTFDAQGEIELTLRVDGVALNVPTTESGLSADQAAEGSSGDPLRLSEVAGDIVIARSGLRAEITGRADTIRYNVAVDVWRTDESATFISRLRTEPFRLDDDMSVLAFAPDVVIERLSDFIEPRAEVAAEVWIARGKPPEGRGRIATATYAAPRSIIDRAAASEAVVFQGRMDVSDGITAFRDFPYGFESVRGAFVFGGGELRLEDIRGVAPSGARLAVNGFVAPLGPEAEVDIEIVVTGVPIDADLYAALGDDRKDAFDQLFNARRYAELLEEDLVLPAERADALRAEIATVTRERDAWIAAGGVQRAEIAALNSRLAGLKQALAAKPEFRFGGLANADIRLHRLPGEISVWTRTIDIDAPTAGLIPKHFPVPVLGRDLRLRLTRDTLELYGGKYTTLAGGDIAISVVAAAAPGDTGALAPPTIEITGHDIPIDPLLLRAIPGPGTGDDAEPDQLARILRDMRLNGTLSADARIFPDPTGDLTYFIKVGIEHANARPGDRLTLDDIKGVIVIDPDEVVLGVDTRFTAGDTRSAPSEAVVFLSIMMERDAGPTRIYTETRAPDLDLTLPVEDLVAVFAPDLSGTIESLRREHEPQGHAHVQVSVVADPAPGNTEDPALDVVILGGRDVSVRAGEARVTLDDIRGIATLTTVPAPRLRFDGFGGELGIKGRAAGRLRLDGTLALAEPDRWPLIGSLPTLRARVEGSLFESALTRDIIASRLDDDAASLYTRLDPQGVFDLELWLEREQMTAGATQAAEGPPLIEAGTLGNLRAYGSIRPRSLAITLDDHRITVPSITGLVRFTERGGVFEDMTASTDAWNAQADGTWSIGQAGAFGLLLRGDLQANTLPTDLLPLLPSAVRDVLANLEFTAAGPFNLSNGVLDYTRPASQPSMKRGAKSKPTAPPPRFDVSADLAVADAAFRVGLPVTSFNGSSGLRAWSRDEAAPGEATNGLLMDINAQALRINGVALTNARARVVSGERPGEILIPELFGDMHKGRMSASVRMGPSETDRTNPLNDDATPTDYWTRIRLSDVRLAGVMASDEENTSDPIAPPTGDDRSRGIIDADITLTGPLGSFDGARGRGTLRAHGGAIVDFPLLLSLVEFSNLQLPTASRIDFGEADFFIRDDVVSFETINVASGSIEILGYGEMQIPSTDLDLRFTSTGHQRLPVLSDVMDSIRNEFIVTKIGGTLNEPIPSTDQFPATRRILAAIMGRQESPEAARMLELERGASEPQNRSRRRLRESPDTLILPVSPAQPGEISRGPAQPTPKP